MGAVCCTLEYGKAVKENFYHGNLSGEFVHYHGYGRYDFSYSHCFGSCYRKSLSVVCPCYRLPGEAYLETLIVLDGTTGQNAMAQAKQFKEATDISGIILTKLDGTAKGGIAIAIQSELGIPVKYIGIGEQVDDLQRFDPDMFVNALFEKGEEN